MEINLISDTVTRPSKDMLAQMMAATVGDDVFGDDPTVNALQDKVAKLFGMEAALFFPSGTMANQAAIKLHTQPGDKMYCDKFAHVYNFEGGGAAFNSGVTCSLLDGDRGMFTAAQLEDAITPKDNIHLALSSLVCIENTTNKGGGACWDFKELQKIRAVCDAHNLSFHLDGARLFNALVVNGETPQQYGQLFDTISICLSKGLGAPVGSVLIGSKADMEKALRIRKLFGGGMRQAGYLAQAAIYALDNNVQRLANDHQKAKELGEVLTNCTFVSKVEPIETNIVIFYLTDDINEDDFIAKMKTHNILLISMGGGKLRMVTHLNYTNDMHEACMQVLKSFD
ncbi:MAG: threonine aldolase family protein [Flavobacteriaceae bacterium]